jgi:histidine ammonia-lyase
MDKFIVDNKNIDILSFLKLVNNASIKLELSCEVARQVEESRKLLDKFVHEGIIIYGVNTSMGGFVNYVVPVDFAEKLQLNLLHSVASNVGDFFDDKIVRAVI